jgi:hypothetical protein
VTKLFVDRKTVLIVFEEEAGEDLDENVISVTWLIIWVGDKIGKTRSTIWGK